MANNSEQKMLTFKEALTRIESSITPLSGSEQVSIVDALGRVAKQDVNSPIAVPAHTNSAMDGYAFRFDDITPSGEPTHLIIIGGALAGKPFDGEVKSGECVRIMTGAVLPQGADTVVMQEQVEATDSGALIGGEISKGQNVRQAGEDLQQGGVALAAGKRIRPAELGLLASIGVSDLTVTRRPKVAFFSTGDELRSIGERLEVGQIYDSNRYTLMGMLKDLGVEIEDMGIIPDDRRMTREAFTAAAATADMLITSAGVSVGEADYIAETLASLGSVDFWKLAIKPGRPLAFGQIGNAQFFGLPGNPVAVMVTFHQFVVPALRRMMGESTTLMPRFRVQCDAHLRKIPGRLEFQRGVLFQTKEGSWRVTTTGQQGSGILNSMSQANCFIILSEESSSVEPGMEVVIQPF